MRFPSARNASCLLVGLFAFTSASSFALANDDPDYLVGSPSSIALNTQDEDPEAGSVETGTGLALSPIEETSIARDPFSTGLLEAGESEFDGALWKTANADALSLLLDEIDARPSLPGLGTLFRDVLLTNGSAPTDATSTPTRSLGGQKLLLLAAAGYTEEVRTIASISNASTTDPWVGQALAVADLLDGNVDEACRRNAQLRDGRDASFWVQLRVVCYAVNEKYDAADLTLKILREQGRLASDDEALLEAISIPAPLKEPIGARNGLQLAIVKALGPTEEVTISPHATVGVLKAVAKSDDFSSAARADAAIRAAASGLMTTQELAGLYDVLPVEGDVDLARAQIDDAPFDPLTDVLVYKSVELMAAPDFVRDRSALIAAAINAAPSFDRAFALVTVFADEIADFDGIIVSTDEAAAFALAAMAQGDTQRASQWMLSMLGGGLATLDDETATRFLELNGLLALLDPISGGAVAAAANVELSEPRAHLSPPGADENRDRLADLVQAAIGAVDRKSQGQAALATLALHEMDYRGDPVANVAANAVLKSAGLNQAARTVAFQKAWRGLYPEPVDAPVSVTQPREDRGMTPRLKPNN